MKISKSLRFTVNNRKFENITVDVGAMADHRDLGIEDDDLAGMDHDHIVASLEALVTREVDRLAEEELLRVQKISENEDNLARDFLVAFYGSTPTPPTTKPRSQHAREPETATKPQTGRRLRRGGPPSAA